MRSPNAELQRLSDYARIAAMEDNRWLRLVTIGLILAAIAIGYFLLAQRFSGTKVSNTGSSEVVSMTTSPTPEPTSSPVALGLSDRTVASPTPQPTQSAYSLISERTRTGTQSLPATGSPAILIGALSASAILIGWGLRKFPH